ncbi:unnamed protein product [Mytilus coruscus]|uniref:NTR domain-containing protein n=1 Tax=Mytilus coruscus TaxID=42192 RepID=A0A6J8BSJ8_MYTCO|nr:unnamed protein product [Mytilus coruscus]
MKVLVQALTAVVMALSIQPSYCKDCSCEPEHPQTSICNADFAFIGYIDNVASGGTKDSPGETVYDVEVQFWLKGNIGQPGDNVELITPNDPALCGLTGDAELKRRKYIFTGKISGNKKVILQCRDFVKEIHNLSQQQWIFLLRGRYLQNCKCEIENDKIKSAPKRGCTIPDNVNVQCLFDTSYIMDDSGEVIIAINHSFQEENDGEITIPLNEQKVDSVDYAEQTISHDKEQYLFVNELKNLKSLFHDQLGK